MIRADKWKRRECVERYRSWADEARLAATGSPTGRIEADVLALHAYAHFPMPESWSAAKKTAHVGRLHRAKPDGDNVCKAVMDSLFAEDKTVAVMQCTKLWCEENEQPRTDVFLLVAPVSPSCGPGR